MRLALLTRQVGLWLLVRGSHALFLKAFVGLADPAASASLAGPAPAVVLVCAALGFVELRLRHERILLGNLGISWSQIAAILVVPPALIEAAIGVAGRL